MSKARNMARFGLPISGLLLVAGVVWATTTNDEPRTRTLPPKRTGDHTVSTAPARADRGRPAATPVRSARPVVSPRSDTRAAANVPDVAAPGAANVTTRPVPEKVVLNQLENLYGPVPFNHKTHVRMAEMSGGCTVCHHHTPQGQEHSACKSCHSNQSAAEDVAMPGLKGAYHRQCLSCHQEWTHDTACNSCHTAKPRAGTCSETPTFEELAAKSGRMPAPVAPRDTFVFATKHEAAPVVTFHHADHVQTFGLKCVDCHRGDSCSRCHDATPERNRTLAHHSPSEMKGSCMACHKESKCTMCHDQSQRSRFDHAARTGWSLAPNHAKLECSACHGDVKNFESPTRNCHACHAEHRRTGPDGTKVQLTAVGKSGDMDCIACHTKMRDRMASATSVHGPASKQSGCKACHNMESEASPRPVAAHQDQMCVKCHDKSLRCENGRQIANVVALISDASNKHRPFREGRCTTCHDPHGSGHKNLLVRDFPAGLYAPFAVERYALCFGCHDAKKVQSEFGVGVTGFRDGERNLHAVHVNKEKGRSCVVCHDVHGSKQPFQIRGDVPFGDSKWSLKLNYHKTDSGGSCGPGCHSEKSYDRTTTGRASAENRQRGPGVRG